MEKRVTDLDKFARTEVYNPFKSMLPVAVVVNLHNAVLCLTNHPDWAECVVDRINRCGYWFPHYIKHELVDYLNERREEIN